jgi:hypothetical protein
LREKGRVEREEGVEGEIRAEEKVEDRGWRQKGSHAWRGKRKGRR